LCSQLLYRYNRRLRKRIEAWSEANSEATEEKGMKILVAYQSITGNTRKVAGAVFEAIGHQKEMKELGQVSTLEGYDLVFVGFPIMGFGPSPEVTSFLANQAAGKNVALFITHASPEDSEPLQDWLPKMQKFCREYQLEGVVSLPG
jgi:flavodoxin